MATKTTPNEGLVLTPEEVAAIKQIREGVTTENGGHGGNVAIGDLAAALVQAIEATRPPTKKTSSSRRKGSPWDSPNKPKLRRTMYQHGIELLPEQLYAEEIDLLNKIKAGSYCQGFVKVIKRKDRSLDIDYPVRTASQRLKLVNDFGIRDFKELLNRIIAEAADPNKYKGPDEDDD